MKKKIIAVLCSIIMVIPLVLSSPKAAGSSYNNYGTFSKGSYSYSFSTIIEQTEIGINLGTEGVGLNIPWATGSSFTINFQFNDTYSGTVRFTLNSNTGVGYRLLDCLWACDGGYFVSSELPSLTTTSTSKTFYIHVYNSQSVSFTIVSSGVNTFHPTSTQFTGFGVSSFYFDLTDSPDIVDASDYLKDIDFYIPGMSTNLSNIYDSLGYTSLDNDTLKNDISILKANTDGLEGLLTQLQTVSMYNIEPYQHAAWIYASKYDSSFPRWKYGLPYMDYSISYNSQNYTASHGIRLANGYSYAMMFYSSKALTTSNMTIYYNGTGDVSVSTLPITEINSQLYLMGIIFKNERSGFSSFDVEFDQNFELYPLYFGLTNNIPDEINAIFGCEYDNTYTRLLNSINTGISNIAGDYDTSQYDSYEQTIDGLNDSLRDTFDNNDNTFQSSLNEIFSRETHGGTFIPGYFTSHFGNVSAGMNNLLGQIFIAAPELKYIFLFGLFLLVLGVLF